MERVESTALFAGPSDAELDAVLDAAGFAADEGDDDSEPTTEEPETSDDDTDSEDLDDEDDDPELAADEDDEAEDDGDDTDTDSDEDEEELPDPRELKRQLDQLTAEREQEREQVKQALAAVGAERQRQETANLLLEVRAKMTDAEWRSFTAQMTEGFKDHQIRALQHRLQSIEQAEQTKAFETAENAALEGIIGQIGKELGSPLSVVEERVIRQSQSADDLHENLKTIVESRRRMTEPARRAAAAQRKARGADRPGVRPSGNARPKAKTYDNLDLDAALDASISDAFAVGR